MDAQQMLGVLLNTTEQQSHTTEKLLAALKGQVEALNAATQAAQRAASTVGQSAATVEQAARNAAPAIQKAAGEAIGVAVRDSLAGASETAANALREATGPVVGNLSSVVQSASEAEASLKNAGQWFAWKWVAVAAGGLAGVCLVAYASLWWQIHQIESLSEQKAELEANVAMLEKRGGKIKIQNCGGRLCIEVSTNQGQGQNDWRGLWKGENGTPLVIPKGY